MIDSERKFVDLLYRVSKKYAAWDPELPVHVGDYGVISTGRTGLLFFRKGRGTFIKEGNIYDDGLAEEFGIPKPKEYGDEGGDETGEGVSWIVSENAREFDVDLSPGG